MENLTYPFQLHQRHTAEQADLLGQIIKRQASYPKPERLHQSYSVRLVVCQNRWPEPLDGIRLSC